MKVTVFGATGAIGSLAVGELLDNGHSVVAYARNPTKLPVSLRDRVEVVTGELSDGEAINRAVSGADAVISALGPSLDKNATGFPILDGTKLILSAMQANGVKRFIGHATPSFKDPIESTTWMTMLVGFLGRTLYPRGYKEVLAMCDLIVKTNLDWTIVRFIAPNDKPKTGKVTTGFFGEQSFGFACTRGDIAAYTASQIEDTRNIKRAPCISN